MTCMYRCRGYGAIVTFPQHVLRPCPSIDPITGLVHTEEIHPDCRNDEPCKKKVPNPNPIPLIIIILLIISALAGGPGPIPAT